MKATSCSASEVVRIHFCGFLLLYTMLPYLHKYITGTPSITSSIRSSKSKRNRASKSRKRRSSNRSSNKSSKSKNKVLNNNNDNDINKTGHQQSESQQQSLFYTKPSITISSDTIHSNSNCHFDTISSNHSSNSHSHSNSIHFKFDDHKYNELPSTSESKVIFIETKQLNDNDKQTNINNVSDSLKSSKPSKKQKTKSIKYWTVSIASKHNECIDDNTTKIVMGFGICDISQSSALKEIENEEKADDKTESMDEFDTAQLLKSNNYEYNDNIKYQSCHTKLKSLDDILISFNTKTNKLTLWQNGKRFNRIFPLQSNKIYGFGIKLYGDDYSIKIMSNTGR